MKRNTDWSTSDAHRTTDFPTRDGLELLLPQSPWVEIQREMVDASHHKQETGGILIGARSRTNAIYVAEATGPGSNASHYRTEFSPDVAHAQRQLDAAREDLDVFWIGTWHKHPGDFLSLSNGDIKQMRNLVRDPDTLDEVVSVILTEENGTAKARGFHMDESLEPHHLPIELIPDDAPIRKEFERDNEPIHMTRVDQVEAAHDPQSDETTPNRNLSRERSADSVDRRRGRSRDRGSDNDADTDHHRTGSQSERGSADDSEHVQASNDSQSADNSSEGDTDFETPSQYSEGDSSNSDATETSDSTERDATSTPKAGPEASHVSVTSSSSDGKQRTASEIDAMSLNSDGSLQSSDDFSRGAHVPQTATEWAILDAGTRALNDLYRPGYEPPQFVPSRDDAHATFHDDGRISFSLLTGAEVEVETDRVPHSSIEKRDTPTDDPSLSPSADHTTTQSGEQSSAAINASDQVSHTRRDGSGDLVATIRALFNRLTRGTTANRDETEDTR